MGRVVRSLYIDILRMNFLQIEQIEIFNKKNPSSWRGCIFVSMLMKSSISYITGYEHGSCLHIAEPLVP